jgi:membrane associated rhomboid family serine protease
MNEEERKLGNRRFGTLYFLSIIQTILLVCILAFKS